ncbi:MAG: hypothetical protein WA708_03205 [Acidobacteriaceae bacterium]
MKFHQIGERHIDVAIGDELVRDAESGIRFLNQFEKCKRYAIAAVVREQRKFVEFRDVQDEIPRDLGVLADGVAVTRGRFVGKSVARKIEGADAEVGCNFPMSR